MRNFNHLKSSKPFILRCAEGLAIFTVFIVMNIGLPVWGQETNSSLTPTSAPVEQQAQSGEVSNSEVSSDANTTQGADAPESRNTLESPASNNNANNDFGTSDTLATLKLLEDEISRFEAQMAASATTTVKVATIRERIGQLRSILLAMVAQQSPVRTIISNRLKELGPQPADGEAEDKNIQVERTALTDSFNKVDALIKRANLNILKCDQVLESIAANERSNFYRQILNNNGVLLFPSTWQKLFSDVAPTANFLTQFFLKQYGVFNKFEYPILAFLTAILPLFLIFYFIFLFDRHIAKRVARLTVVRSLMDSQEFEGRGEIILKFLVRIGLVWSTIYIWREISLFMGFITLSFRNPVSTLLYAAPSCLFISALPTIFLKPRGRMEALQDNEQNSGTASSIAKVQHYFRFLALALFIYLMIDSILSSSFAPLSSSILLGTGYTLVCSAIAIRLIKHTRTFSRENYFVHSNYLNVLLIRIFAKLIWLASFLIPAATFVGYVVLGSFAVNYLFLLGGLLGIYELLLLLGKVISQFVFRHREEQQRGDFEESDVSDSAIQGRPSQLSVLVSGVWTLAISFAVLTLAASPLGVNTVGLFKWLETMYVGVEVGGITISPSNIISSLIIIILGIAITRALQLWLRLTYLPSTKLDVGLQASIAKAVGYIGIITAFILASVYLGFELSNIALVAGALSVGIGFGLQSIVNNFVSGLILLIERPFKEGDWVVVGNEEGFVNRINVRSTEIKTFDEYSVIVPNSDFIANNVKNMTHGSKSGRVLIFFGVSYDADPDEVKKIVMGILKSHPLINKNKHIAVLFLNFGDNALEFRAQFCIDNVLDGIVVKDQINTAILNELRKANIGIPYPQRDVHVHFANSHGDMDRFMPKSKSAD